MLAENYQPAHPIPAVPLDEELWRLVGSRPTWDGGLDDNDQPWLAIGLEADRLIVMGYTYYGGDDEGGTRVAELKLAAPLGPELAAYLVQACFQAGRELGKRAAVNRLAKLVLEESQDESAG